MFRLVIIACALTFAAAGLEKFDFGGHFHDNSNLRKLDRFFSKRENPKNKKSDYNVCRTEECFKVAAELWESMNKSVDPCEDFYEYACGSWSINNPVPPTKMTWDFTEKTEKLVKDRISDLLEESVHPDDILPVKQLKKFYRSCMNVDALEKMGVKPLEAILIRNGGWPIAMEAEEWDAEEFMWQRIDKYYLKLTGSSALFDIRISPDYRDIDIFSFADDEQEIEKMVLELTTPNLPSVVLKNPDQRFNRATIYENGTYAKLITEIALIFAKERNSIIDKDQIAADVADMIDLEKKLDDFSGSYRNNKCVKLEELQIIYNNVSHHTETSKINWKSLFTDYLAVGNVEINRDDDICIRPLVFLKELAQILKDTKPRTIVNYVHWNFLSQFISYTTSEMRKLQYNLTKAVAGVKEETPRSEMCAEEMKMNHAIAYQFVKKFFKDEMKQDAEKLFAGVQKAMMKHILKADWLDDEMRKIVLHKIQKMGRNIGYPNWYNNATFMANYYRGMTIGHQFLDNVLSYKIFSLKNNLRTLRNRTREDIWSDTDPMMVNAFYNQQTNTLTIPAGEFQTVFYSPTLPRIITYGNIGFTVGHEVSHGFDVDGIEHNENGNKINPFYSGTYEYKKRSDCFISQYEEFYADSSTNDNTGESCSGLSYYKCFFMGLLGLEEPSPIRRDAKEKQAENIADSMGVEMIFEALEDIEKEKNSPRFPGFEDMTNEQFFFVSYANVWCQSSTPKYKHLMDNYDSHSEPRYRVIAAVQNSEEFAKVYKCPKGSPMNPERKCKIW